MGRKEEKKNFYVSQINEAFMHICQTNDPVCIIIIIRPYFICVLYSCVVRASVTLWCLCVCNPIGEKNSVAVSTMAKMQSQRKKMLSFCLVVK